MAQDPWFIERIEPMHRRLTHGWICEHLARYDFAAGLLRGRILDAGSGTGYGTLMLASQPDVREVVGIDANARAVEWARRYYGAPNVRYVQEDLLSDRLHGLGRFDGIACLEVLEHLPEPERLLRQLDLCLAPGGCLLVSTPVGRGRDEPTLQPHHYFQLRREEFEAMLGTRFRYTLFGQRSVHIEMWRPAHRYFLMLARCRSRFETREAAEP
mgnify:CR=1 FL=1